VADKLSVTAGARFNIAQIDLLDETGAEPLLNSAAHYQRLNPVIGATYKFSPALTAYAGYSEANRAPNAAGASAARGLECNPYTVENMGRPRSPRI
jgi:outer membrane receptor protein involved in Fe transport